MKIRLVQTAVDKDPLVNLSQMRAAIGEAQTGEWVVFPEAALSGYAPEDEDYLRDVDPGQLEEFIAELTDLAAAKRCIAFFGSASHAEAGWSNSAYICNGISGKPTHTLLHKKQELSKLDKLHFVRGDALNSHSGEDCMFGVQLCREVLFPDAWRSLRRQGAKIIFHLNNALKPKDAIWEHVLIARAVENGMYVCSVNNACAPQSLGSYLISPSGEKLISMTPQRQYCEAAHIDLSVVAGSLEDRTDF